MNWSASGVIRGFGDEFEPFADSSGMQVKVKGGQCWQRGHWGESTTQKTLAIAAADATNPRKDRVVLRADFGNNRIELAVLTGTPAVTPTAPSMTQNTLTWETSVAVVDVAAGVITIAATDAVDDRQFIQARARYYKTSLQAIPTATNTVVTFTGIQTESPGDIVQIDDSTFELRRSGQWALQASIQWAAGTTGRRSTWIGKSGDIVDTRYAIGTGSAAGDFPSQNVSTMIYLASGERVSVGAWQNQGTALDIVPNYNATNIAITWLGP
jgi:hypothetical protein